MTKKEFIEDVEFFGIESAIYFYYKENRKNEPFGISEEAAGSRYAGLKVLHGVFVEKGVEPPNHATTVLSQMVTKGSFWWVDLEQEITRVLLDNLKRPPRPTSVQEPILSQK